jgi:hypothetical protein
MATKKTVPAKKTAAKKTPAKKATTKKVESAVKTPKELATERGEPWISVISVELDPDNIGNGAFELDWNDKFVTNLVRAGYQSKPDEEDTSIVDRWFQDVCRNVVMENFEQWEANQPYDARPRVIDKKDLGDGRTEVS